jgi:hypothetical protein
MILESSVYSSCNSNTNQELEAPKEDIYLCCNDAFDDTRVRVPKGPRYSIANRYRRDKEDEGESCEK